MTTTPDEHAGGAGGAIHIAGSVTGNVQTGSHARAEYTRYGGGGAGAAETAAVRQLLAAVEALREQLRAADPAALPGGAAQAAEAALEEVAEAAPGTGEPERGRIQRAVFTLTGALASAAGLAEAVRALRDAAAPWF
ncbi:DUF5955 family protein [Peterkaempfera bronchialis]|uniref:Uncharacterized protein n=1 Tax=Peterkaempfera bronchialis TaxID=2126346 RepID=A0A345T243_9ACTN|nr:DUF5955 family protein [Peterkaempfera bronchialis]AXI80048.1 hypothetical protein C7M71_024235 [Peterkaempfera bronchialis]